MRTLRNLCNCWWECVDQKKKISIRFRIWSKFIKKIPFAFGGQICCFALWNGTAGLQSMPGIATDPFGMFRNHFWTSKFFMKFLEIFDEFFGIFQEIFKIFRNFSRIFQKNFNGILFFFQSFGFDDWSCVLCQKSLFGQSGPKRLRTIDLVPRQ